MGAMFGGPKVNTPKPVKTADAEEARAKINLARRQASGSYADTILGSGLKTALGQ